MGKKQVRFLFDEYIYTQFQSLYPRQATRILQNTMKDMINLKLDCADEEIEKLRDEAEESRKQMEEQHERLSLINSKINAWEAKKRKELLEKKKEEEEIEERKNQEYELVKQMIVEAD